MAQTVKFDVPAALLAQLRQRREEKRAERAARDDAPARSRPRGLLEHFRQLVDGERKDVEGVADEFVHGMKDLQDEVEREHDAFLLDPGMGPMAYLTADGRVLLDYRAWDGDPLREADEDEAISTLVAGAKNTGFSSLLDLIPQMPESAASCFDCGGTRWMTLPGFDPNFQVVCPKCRGRGWRLAPA